MYGYNWEKKNNIKLGSCLYYMGSIVIPSTPCYVLRSAKGLLGIGGVVTGVTSCCYYLPTFDCSRKSCGEISITVLCRKSIIFYLKSSGQNWTIPRLTGNLPICFQFVHAEVSLAIYKKATRNQSIRVTGSDILKKYPIRAWLWSKSQHPCNILFLLKFNKNNLNKDLILPHEKLWWPKSRIWGYILCNTTLVNAWIQAHQFWKGNNHVLRETYLADWKSELLILLGISERERKKKEEKRNKKRHSSSY